MLRRSSSLTFQPKASSAASTSLVKNSEDPSYVKYQLAGQYSGYFYSRFLSFRIRIQRALYSNIDIRLSVVSS